jgi:CRISPR system Cascade subunit CasB
MTADPKGIRFVDRLEKLSGNRGNRPDAGAMAALRRGIGHGLADIDPAVMPYVTRFMDADEGPELFALLGNLYAKHPQHTANAENLGAALARAMASDSQERRFHSLLAARGDELVTRLREAVSLLASAEQPLDYVRLYQDLAGWEDDQRKVQMGWAREFWRNRGNAEALKKHREQAEEQLTENDWPEDRRKRAQGRHAFILYLHALAAHKDRSALADLRSGLGRDGLETRMLPHVAPFMPLDRPWEWRGWFLVASLFGLHPHHREQPGDSLAKAWRTLIRQSNHPESQEKRFIALLDAEPAELGHHLRQAVSLLRSKEHPLDYGRLLDHVLSWGHYERWVQRRWAAEFWG